MNSIKRTRIWVLALVAFIVQSISLQAQITEKPGFGKYAITGATVHTITEGTMENAVVLINGHNIVEVGMGLSTAGYTVIDASGKHVFPGMIDSGTTLGLSEVSSVDVTNDQREVGSVNPEMRAFTAINPNSVAIPVTRVSGVTTVISHPEGFMAGKATLINLFGYTPDSMAVRQDAAMHLAWPASGKRGWWDTRSEKDIQKQYDQQVGMIEEWFKKAAYYHTLPQSERSGEDTKIEALIPVVTGELPLMITVNRESDIRAALKWVKTQDKLNVIFSSVSEGWRVADEIAEAGIPCLVGPVQTTPTRDHDHYAAPYKNAGLLHKAGVKVAIRTGQTENVRNLPFNAAFAAAWGLGKEEALKAVTINAAEIFGVADKIGSISAGKMANLVIADGDMFEPMTQIEHVFINGFKIPMDSRHIQLYQEFLDRDAVEK